MQYLKSGISAAIIALSATCHAQFVLQPNEATSKDAKVYEHVPGMSLQSDLMVTGTGSGAIFKSLIEFDLSTISIPTDQISLVTLEIYASAVGTAGDVSLYPITAAWGETTVNFTNYPTFSATAADTLTIATAAQWYSFDVTEAVKNWHSGVVPNFGFAIIMDTAAGNVTFLDAGGRETAPIDPTLAPRLTVVPEPGTALLGLVGLAACGFRRVRKQHSI
jgi:hypothetical protein